MELLQIIFKVRKIQFWLLLSIWANISDTVHTITNGYMKHIYKVIYNLSVYIKTLDFRLDYLQMSNKGHKQVVSHKRYIVLAKLV